MFNKVIVGIDELTHGRDALALATRLASEDGQLLLAHVFFDGTERTRRANVSRSRGELQFARRLLADARDALGRDAELCPVPSASVGTGLHMLAEHRRADLIVVGSAERGPIGRLLHGDDLRDALEGAPCAVAVAPRAYADRVHRIDTVAIGYDGTVEATHALSVGREFAAERDGHVVVCEVVPRSPQGFAEARHRSEEEISRELSGVRARLQALGDDLEVHAAYGDPAEELAFYGARVDLLIVGSRNFGKPGSLRHGRTTMQLGMLARCPLIVLPRPVTGAEGHPMIGSEGRLVA